MIAAALVALALSAFGAGQEAPASREALRTLVALDREQEAVARFAHLVRPGAPWAADGEAIALVARALVAVGQEDEALALLGAASPTAGAAAVELETARTLLALDRLDQALEVLCEERGERRALRHPDDPDALVLFARIQVRRGRGEGVEAACRRFLELAPLHPEAQRAWYILAQQALARGEGAEAERCFAGASRAERWNALLRARELQVLEHPDDALPRLGLALVWMEAGAFERARPILEDLLRRHPDDARGWYHLAETRRRLGEDPHAALDRALALEPGHAEALYRRGTLLGASSDPAERARGLADLERLLGGPGGGEARFREAWWQLAAARAAAGDAPGAAEAYERYRALGGERERPG